MDAFHCGKANYWNVKIFSSEIGIILLFWGFSIKTSKKVTLSAFSIFQRPQRPERKIPCREENRREVCMCVFFLFSSLFTWSPVIICCHMVAAMWVCDVHAAPVLKTSHAISYIITVNRKKKDIIITALGIKLESNWNRTGTGCETLSTWAVCTRDRCMLNDLNVKPDNCWGRWNFII